MGGFLCCLFLSPLIGAIIIFTSKSLETEKREQQALALQKQQTAALQQMQKAQQPQVSTAEEIKKLADLRDGGHLTEEEFAQQKARLLNA